MKALNDNLWWIFLTVFWIAFIVLSLVWWEPFSAVLGVLCLVGHIASALVTINQRRQLRYQRATIASLERSLKEAHRHD